MQYAQYCNYCSVLDIVVEITISSDARLVRVVCSALFGILFRLPGCFIHSSQSSFPSVESGCDSGQEVIISSIRTSRFRSDPWLYFVRVKLWKATNSHYRSYVGPSRIFRSQCDSRHPLNAPPDSVSTECLEVRR
jgi:hypothetical protein